ncbi:hypothetical protein [Streptomyces sp. SP18CS02]|uniref:hypothetical protein n=1 Tax=Streptomyces sp. SP18CS02 TaxID=3002531 RepID=UPI002E7A87F7|nr:hypothetical protein [Streptomyces sp. SP18CS02]MEE1756838.1 hypothetical protein [Streptomyces sp. SP18CS02]
MSGDSYYYGPNVNMRGGTGNIGMVNNHGATGSAPAASPEMQAAVAELLRLVDELRDKISPATAEALDETLPAVAAPGDDGRQQQRRMALLTLSGIAATAGSLGQPVVDAVNRVLELLAQ